MLTAATLHAAPTAGALAGARRPRARQVMVVTASRQEGTGNKGMSGIHDPVGWGQRGGAMKPLEAGLEQQRQLQAQALGNQQERSGQAAQPGGASIDRYEAANKELREVQQEKAAIREESASDDEWAHMSAPAKWWMELKALLYSWLGTGVEPL